jgi:NDP-sugar pyrophosphorylase family protein
VIYGDTLTNIDVNDFKNHHINKGKAVSIVVASIQNPFGLVTFNEEGVAASFQEKPYLNYYIGMFLLSKSAFDYIDDQMLKEPDGEGLVSFFKRLIDEKQLMAYHYTGKQITFNTHREKEIAEEVIKTFFTL